jgi:hypothetical protein
MKRMLISVLLMTLAVAGCVVDGGYYDRGQPHRGGGWGDRGDHRPHEQSPRHYPNP